MPFTTKSTKNFGLKKKGSIVFLYIQQEIIYYQQNDLSDLHSPIWLAIYIAHIAKLIHVNVNFLLLATLHCPKQRRKRKNVITTP